MRINLSKITQITFWVSIFTIAFLPTVDVDFGWHYQCGQKIIQNGSLCINNEFTYFLSDYKWAYSSFLYDFLLAFSFNLGGFIAISLFGAILLTSIVFIFYKNLQLKNETKYILVFIVLGLSATVIGAGPRPQLISLGFYLFTLGILLDNQEKLKKSLYLLPVIFLAWVNSHAGFFLGPVILGLFVIDAILRKTVPYKLLGVSALALLATLPNPFGYKVYIETLNHWRVPLYSLIAEWVPSKSTFIILIAILAYLFFFAQSQSKKKLNTFNISLIILVTYFGIAARRNLPIYFFTYALLIQNVLRDYEQKINYTGVRLGVLSVIFVIGLTIGGNNIYESYRIANNWDAYCTKGVVKYPCEAIKYFENKTGNVYNTYEWGGFLIWQIPNMQIFVDGRMPAWVTETKESPYTTYLNIIQAQKGWNEQLDAHDTDYLLIQNGTFLDLLLEESSEKYDYTEEFRDDMSVIYKRVR